MNVKVIKGTNQIGGCITEISSDKAKIIIDFGKDLEGDKDDELEGLTYGNSVYDAVFITHSHGDHIGLINKVNNNIDVYVDEKSLIIHNISCDFMNTDVINRKIKTFDVSKEESIYIKDICVTPYIVDHSSYNSCMFLIESDGKRILHTGDFRNHGRKSSLFEKTLNKIGKINMLITEGTSLARTDSKYKSEFEIEKEAMRIFNEYDQVFVMQSSTNIDRTVSFVRAAIRSEKSFVMDLFTKSLVNALNINIKQDNKNIFVWEPVKYSKKSDDFKEKYMEQNFNYGFLPNFVMQVKESMLSDIKVLNNRFKFTNACLVYSMWEGYVEKEEKLQIFIKELKSMKIKFVYLHTSGHGDKDAMSKMESILDPDTVIVVHTDDNNLGKKVFKNYKAICDCEIIRV